MADPKESLSQLKKNLNTLREREAKCGRNVPLELLNQIEDHERAIPPTRQAITGELSRADWQAAMKSLLLAVHNGQVVNICANLLAAGPFASSPNGPDLPPHWPLSGAGQAQPAPTSHAQRLSSFWALDLLR